MASNEKDSPISLLKTLSEIDGNLEYFAVAKDGTTYKCTPAQLKDFVLKGETPVVRIPLAVLNLSNSSSSEDILNAFGGKDAFMDICQSIVNKDTVCVVANILEESGRKLVYIPVMAMATYTDANNANFTMAIITETTFQLVVTVTDGIATQSSQVLNHIYEAPSDGNVYGRKNKDWVKVPENSNVIILPKEILDLTGSSSSEEILAAFGGIDKYKDLLEKLSTNNCLVQIGEPSLGSLRHIYTLVEYAVNFASNKQSGALSLNIYNEEQQLRRFHFYLENNGTTARCGEANTFQLVRDTDVLTKTNTSSFTPTQPYHPATKKYVDDINYGKVINVSVGTYLVTNKNEKDREAIDLINAIFGSVDNLKEIIQDIIANHTKYYFHSYNSENNCIELSSIYSFHNPETEEYNLQCNISYYINGPASKRMGFKLAPNDEDCAASIEDILTSDNLQRVVKRTKSEYGSISAKDNSTMYAVTE